MSRVFFHTLEDGDAALAGSERAYGANLCAHLLLSVLRLHDTAPLEQDMARYRQLLPAGSYLLDQRWSPSEFVLMLRTALHVGDQDILIPGTAETHVPAWQVALNTAAALGGDVLRLLAKLHGQCELHAYIEGPNRAWLAGIIDEGLESRVLRSQLGGYSQGWERVAALLRTRDDRPVVLSYSVCDQFPNSYVAGYPGAEADAFDDLSDEERWDKALAGLRGGRMGEGLEWQPATWSHGFSQPMAYSAFDILDAWNHEE